MTMTVDPCPSCGAAMAADQRYCLACGERRAEARLDYLEVLRGAPVAAVTAAPAALAADTRQRANVTMIASIGCLLLAMGVGVLIGTAGDNESAVAPAAAAAPQVIRVQGGGTSAAGTAGVPKKEGTAKEKRTGAADTETAATAAESRATNPEIQALDSLSPEDYQKQSQKLPKTVSTGGKAPPIDKSKPAGDGSDFDEIG